MPFHQYATWSTSIRYNIIEIKVRLGEFNWVSVFYRIFKVENSVQTTSRFSFISIRAPSEAVNAPLSELPIMCQ
jgi:hypothetical protein